MSHHFEPSIHRFHRMIHACKSIKPPLGMSSSVPRIKRRTTKQEDNEVDRVLRYGEGGSRSYLVEESELEY